MTKPSVAALVDRAEQHRVHRHIIAAGWAARCCCGWHVLRRTREARDRDAAAHQESTG